MFSIIKNKLPKFIKKSNIFRDIEDEELVFIPKNINIEKLKINSIENYIKMLQTIQYFNLDMPTTMKNFIKLKNNEDEILMYLLPRKNDSFIKEIIDEIKVKFEFEINLKLSDYHIKQTIVKNNKILSCPIFLNFSVYNLSTTFKSSKLEIFDSVNIIEIIDNMIKYSKNKEYYKPDLGINTRSIDIKINKNNITVNFLQFDNIGNNVTLEIYAENNTVIKKRILNSFIELKEKILKLHELILNNKIFCIYYDKIIIFNSKKNLSKENSIEFTNLSIDKFVDKNQKIIIKETGKSMNEEELEKWMIKNNRSFQSK